MSRMEFRALHADEIDCRVSQVKLPDPQNSSLGGVVLLLYKDARVDQMILDETVGPMNWQRRHTRDNANCIVSLWDEEKKQWIEKEDTGTESNTEAEKGLASDSFKRACFNWGIGRELYTAPFIWISGGLCTIRTRKNNQGKDVGVCNDKFTVLQISTVAGKITNLTIANSSRKNEVVFTYNSLVPERSKREESSVQGKSQEPPMVEAEKAEAPKAEPPAPEKPVEQLVSEGQVRSILDMAERSRTPIEEVLRTVGVKDLKELTVKAGESLYKALRRKHLKMKGAENEAQGQTA